MGELYKEHFNAIKVPEGCEVLSKQYDYEELISFAKFYHESKVKNNVTLGSVINPFSCVGCKYHNTTNDELCGTCGDTYKNKAT